MLHLSVLLLQLSVAKPVTISNLKPKLDVNGGIVNAHDGSYRKIGDYYYYHGVEYELCQEPANYGCDQTSDHCGFTRAHNVSVWRSKDLSSGSWEFRGRAISCLDLPECSILYRPHLVYNPRTKLFVLYWNYVAPVGYAGYGVASSSSPDGPFTIQTLQMNITRLCPGPVAQSPCGPGQGGAGDFDVFVDDEGDGSAYLIYGAAYWMSIEKLTPDFLNSTGQNASMVGGNFGGTVFQEYFVEAPVIFKRNKIYYALFGWCCCFCYQGSGIMVYTAPHPLGPWTLQQGGDLACVNPSAALHNSTVAVGEKTASGKFAARADSQLNIWEDEVNGQKISRVGPTLSALPTPDQGCLHGGRNQVSTTKSQQNFVISVPDGRGGFSFIWTGDRWQQSPDGIKGHEGQFWVPLQFGSQGEILPVKWVDEFTVDVA